MIVNAVAAAVVALLVGGPLRLALLTRWPLLHWLPADTFYMVLTAHGIDMLIFWIIFFEIAVLTLRHQPTALQVGYAEDRLGWPTR